MSHLSPKALEALLDGPAGHPPPGKLPQLDNPPNHRALTRAVVITSLTISTLALFMRVYTKTRVIRQVMLADYAIILGWAVSVGFTVPVLFISKVAPGIHEWDLSLRDLITFLKYIHVGSVMYGISIFFIKASILLQYIHIFSPTTRSSTFYWASQALIWINFVFYFASTFIEIFACKPRAKVWNPLLPGHCVNLPAENVAAATVNSVSDITILILPQPVIWRLQMSTRRKIETSIVFTVGIFACAASLLRLSYAAKVFASADISYNTWLSGIWTVPEIAAGIVVACLPVTPKLVQSLQKTKMASYLASSFRLLRTRTPSSPDGGDQHHLERYPTNSTDDTGRPWAYVGQYQVLSDENTVGKNLGTGPAGKTQGL